MSNPLKPLVIGDLVLKTPIIQGGMGVRVSTAPLAAAVADCGAAGTIASVALGFDGADLPKDYKKVSLEALRQEIRKARSLSKGVIGVNILGALTNFEDLARTSAAEGIDYIATGAGLPLNLPELTEGTDTRLIPIVSSARAAAIIIRTWKKRYSRIPDAIVVEGPKAGGHLGFKRTELDGKPPRLEDLVLEVIKTADGIPVIPAGGVFTGADAARFLRLGAAGVQMATRFVATHECTVPQAFKDLYLAATADDIVIIDSPVGLPGRAIRNSFVRKLSEGGRERFKCTYRCLRTCNPAKAPYCIARALRNAILGDIDHAIVFAGANVSRIDRIVSVKELIDEIVTEAAREPARPEAVAA